MAAFGRLRTSLAPSRGHVLTPEHRTLPKSRFCGFASIVRKLPRHQRDNGEPREAVATA